jgi:hypothetical protein
LGIYSTNDWKLINHLHLDLFDLADIMWMPNGFSILAWDGSANYKLLSICPVMGIEHRFEPNDDGLGIKTIAASHNSIFVCVGSYDEKVRLLNALTWKVIGDVECMATSLHSAVIFLL